ncbi:amino acid ABC transporter substrate-binding protein [Clostridia bacterium]|nr:amino acid ABC transporter substrate-binding protein [Clostridia bacterium]
MGGLRKRFFRLIFVLMIGCVMGFTGCKDMSVELNVEAFKKKGELIVLTDPTFHPYEYWDNSTGKPVGVDMDIAKLIAKELGVRLEIHQQTFERLLPALGANEGDVAMAAITLTSENEKIYPHSEPYADACQKILVLKDRSDIEKFNDLANKRVGVPVGTTSATYMQNALKDENRPFNGTNTKLELCNDTQEAIQALRNEHVDAVLLDSYPADYYARKYPESLKVLPELIGTEKYVFMYSKNMSQEVISLIDNIIARIKTDGTLDGFYAKHNFVNTGGSGENENESENIT